MKTYQDLSDEQLVRLAKLAANTVREYWTVVRSERTIRVLSSITVVTFYLVEGDITLEHNGKDHAMFNLWQIVALCQSWGVDYSPKAS